MLFAAILVLCLGCSFGAVCEESQGQVAPAGRHSEVRCPLTGSSTWGETWDSVRLDSWREEGGLVAFCLWISISGPPLFPLSPGYPSVLDVL